MKGIPEVHVISGDILPMMDKSIQAYAMRQLENRAGVKFHLGAMVKEVTDHSVRLQLKSASDVQYITHTYTQSKFTETKI